MKRSILYLLLSMLFGITAIAQNLAIKDTSGTAINNGDTVTIHCIPSGTNYAFLWVKNIGSDSVSVKVKKKEITLVGGSENTFCWGTCYLPSTYVSPDSIWIAPDSISHDFSGDYNAHGNIGISLIMYTFFDPTNIADSAHVFVKYDGVNNSISEKAPEKILFSNAYPNPANNSSTFTYSLPAGSVENRVIVRDMLGNEVLNQLLVENNGMVKIDTYSMSNGVYFYSLFVNGKPYATRKLIVKH